MLAIRPAWQQRSALWVALPLGSALARPFYGPPVYVERVHEPSCFVQRERVWVSGWRWEFRRRTICD